MVQQVEAVMSKQLDLVFLMLIICQMVMLKVCQSLENFMLHSQLKNNLVSAFQQKKLERKSSIK